MEKLYLLEANIDDMSGELLALLPDTLLDAGALDAWLTPIIMKKGRPAHVVSALCDRENVSFIERAIFTHSSTLGVRRREVERTALERSWVTVETKWGNIRIKLGLLAGEVVNAAPEIEDCIKAAKQAGVAVKEVYQAATGSYRNKT